MVDFLGLVELDSVNSLMRRWATNPAFPRIRSGLLQPEQYRHSLVLLVAVSNLSNLGNGVGLYGEGPEGESVPDFWIQVGAQSRLDVEVKAPEELDGSQGPLSSSRAHSALEKGRKKALKGRHRQLKGGTPCILLLGGASLDASSMSTLEKVVTEKLAGLGQRYTHLAAVMLLSFNLLTEGPVVNRGDSVRPGQPVAGGAQIRYVVNPSYAGTIEIRIGS